MIGNSLKDSFERFNKIRCLIIGDVMVDSYIWGAVNRMSPEAPVPVFEVEKRENRMGGAANVALNVQSLGAIPILCGVVGTDSKGQIFKELLKGSKLSTEGILEDNSRATTSKTRVIGPDGHMLRVDEEELSLVSDSIKKSLLVFVESEIAKGLDVIIFEDYDKGVLDAELIKQVILIANKQGVPTCVDPKINNFNNYVGATLFKPNLKELSEGLKVVVKKEDFTGIVQLGKKFIEEQQIKQILITLSEHGVIIANSSDSYHVKAEKRKILDVSGAGDTVISTAAIALAAGIERNDIAVLANLAGGIVCEEMGVVPITKKDLISEYNRLY
ncbi:MAG: rfaE bifunctional protein kinase chain/domain [Glaciecola sp.]|jgi:rfaE bifunctional protein kinase chain/domain